MTRLVGETVMQRKMCLAELVRDHLRFELGHTAELIENRTNSAGHTDTVLVNSSLGLIHLTASSSLDQNERIRTTDYQKGEQNFLADKTYVAYGWNTKDARTIILFVPTTSLVGIESLSRSELQKLSNRELNKVFKN